MHTGITNRAKIFLALGLLVFGVILAPASVFGFSGRVTVGEVNAAPGETVGVPVYLGGNNVAFSGLRLPFRFDSPDLIADSVSSVGSMLDPLMRLAVSIDQDSQYVGVAVFPPLSDPNVPKITADSGLLVTFWFTVSQTASPQVITVDSLNTVDSTSDPQFEEIFRRLEFVIDSEGISIPVTPEFTAGSITLIQTDVNDPDDILVPHHFVLNQNYPNPFNPSTTISFSLPTRSLVTLEIFNILGQSVDRLHSGLLPAGKHKFFWDASRSPSGVYFYRLKSAHGVQTKRMILVK